ncbi:hypothetical protein ACVWY6_003631 [Williamsia sp. R60]
MGVDVRLLTTLACVLSVGLLLLAISTHRRRKNHFVGAGAEYAQYTGLIAPIALGVAAARSGNRSPRDLHLAVARMALGAKASGGLAPRGLLVVSNWPVSARS